MSNWGFSLFRSHVSLDSGFSSKIGRIPTRTCDGWSHITPALYELHWLPVSLRIDYKILLLTFKCIYGLAPTYLSDLISIKSNSLYNLRSTGKLLLDHPKGKMLTTLGARSFSAAAPKLWNELPVELCQATSPNSFKS